jgi:hypothetical protein
MSWSLIQLEDLPASKWRNGGGVTRELLVWPQDARGVAADWDWRLSVADVTDSGPFSRFDGVQRWFAVLQGEGVRLRMDGVGLALTRLSPPFQFDGGAGVDCQLLGGATQDFNLMLRRGRGSAVMARVTGALNSAGIPVGATVAVYAGSTAAQVQLGQENAMIVPAQSLAWRTLDASSSVSVQANHALWMEITP